MSAGNKAQLDLDRGLCAELGRTAVAACESGTYTDESGRDVDWSTSCTDSRGAKISLAADARLPVPPAGISFDETRVQVIFVVTCMSSFRVFFLFISRIHL